MLPGDDVPRRTPGLKREEVARLAGLSEGCYARLEQAREKYPSEQGLQALARALRLNPDAARYLRGPVRDQDRPRPAEHGGVPARPAPDRGPGRRARPGPRLLPRRTGRHPPLGRALYALVLPYGNLVRFAFPDRAARTFCRDWPVIAEAGAAWLRATAGAAAEPPG
ncbi:helix-turn-helix domain-containing protein [Streptomyces flaveolus]|uniref:helix-turn-helix domain-containing protein n=1 Tax=Streptomyces flaveolus TaxID=67297 RepID=UPI0033A16BB3